MKIAVVGLGLIGGSLCKTIKRYTNHLCMGYDKDETVMKQALHEGAIDDIISPDMLSKADFVIISLHPAQTISFLTENVTSLRPETIVIDTCGVKESIIDAVEPILLEHGISFVGCHPMAGREFSGFSYSLDNLFDSASFIITPTVKTNAEALKRVQEFAQEIKFRQVVISNPTEHDRVIAFTSQLAHIVSNAYVKSPVLGYQCGFSAGSFLDLTRVAKLNESMWTQLFLMNRPSLLTELENLIGHLQEYQVALAQNDSEKLKNLLRDGRILKEESLKESQKG